MKGRAAGESSISAAAVTTQDRRALRRWAVLLFVFGVGHRLLQLWLLWPVLSGQILAWAGNQAPTMLPAIIMREHPWWGLWYLQQTPPIPYGIWAVVLNLFDSPYGIAVSSILLQAVLSSLTAVAMALLLRRSGFGNCLSFAIAVVFLLHGDLIVIEYHTMGQMFHNLLTMLLVVLACHQALNLLRRMDRRAAFMLGLCAGLLALTRATFSFFWPVVLVWLILAGAWRRPAVVLAFLLPVLVLHGGWMAKNRVALGHWSSSTSSWGGANLYHGEVLRNGPEQFRQWISERKGLCPSPWYELTVDMPPKSAIFYFIPLEWPESVPADMVEKDRLIAQRRGHAAEWDSLVASAWSRCLMREFAAYWLHHPGLVIRQWWQSYQVFWHPIGQYAVIHPSGLKPDTGDYYSPALNWGRSLREALGDRMDRYLMLRREITLAPLSPGDFVPVTVIALPVLPKLISALNLAVLHSLPLLLLWQIATTRRIAQPDGFWFMLLVYAYAGGLSSLGEYSENMRYRLEVEPIIWVLSALILRGWITCVRRLAARFRPGQPRPAA